MLYRKANGRISNFRRRVSSPACRIVTGRVSPPTGKLKERKFEMHPSQPVRFQQVISYEVLSYPHQYGAAFVFCYSMVPIGLLR
jgi:hypothetical protein